MSEGTVKWFSADKGYGLIKPSDGSMDVFVHMAAVERAGLTGLEAGQTISYQLVPGQTGRSTAEHLKA